MNDFEIIEKAARRAADRVGKHAGLAMQVFAEELLKMKKEQAAEATKRGLRPDDDIPF